MAGLEEKSGEPLVPHQDDTGVSEDKQWFIIQLPRTQDRLD